MGHKKSSYEKAAKKKGLLGEITKDLDTEHNLQNTAIETGKDLVVGVVGGGLVGAFIGKASLLVGAAVTGIGHYTKSRMAAIFGIGMMASNGFQKSETGVNGTDDKKGGDLLEEAKERVMTFKDNFSQKLYIDKLQSKKKDTAKGSSNKPAKTKSEDTSKKSETEEGTEEEKPVGEVQYFVHPSGRELDMSKLDHIENSLQHSAATFRNNGGTTDGLGDADELDPEDHNY